jgi:hypothetical protein
VGVSNDKRGSKETYLKKIHSAAKRLSRLDFGEFAGGFAAPKNSLEDAAHVESSTTTLKPGAGAAKFALASEQSYFNMKKITNRLSS